MAAMLFQLALSLQICWQNASQFSVSFDRQYHQIDENKMKTLLCPQLDQSVLAFQVDRNTLLLILMELVQYIHYEQ